MNIKIVICLILILCVVAIFYFYPHETLNYPTYLYFSIEDKDGNQSVIHNSGIQKFKPGDKIKISYLKKEINNEKEKTISFPKYLYVGVHPKKLKKISDFSVTENEKTYDTVFIFS